MCRRLSSSKILAAALAVVIQQQPHDTIMVMFRSPSHHTYGFIEKKTNNYDLPQIELRSLIMRGVDEDSNIQFIPVDPAITKQEHKSHDNNPQQPMSRNQSKKKKRKTTHPRVPSMYWLKCINDDDIGAIVSKAARRAILTHAVFRISISVYDISGEAWDETSITNNNKGGKMSRCILGILDKIDVVDTSNPNMSRDERSLLIERISYLIERYYPELQSQLKNEIEATLMELHQHPILMHTQREDGTHQLHFGQRIAIGPAGTSSAPSQTLRRTHRGILKKYALKNRVTNAHIISTAMEPEIGFLMANLAAGVGMRDHRKKKIPLRILDPCCGSGRLLLYVAASCDDDVKKQIELYGVDSNPKVWAGAAFEFERLGHNKASIPIFVHGDVQSTMATEVLCSPNSFDVIICDPPYNIGAPILASNGKKDLRPRNYHNYYKDVDEDHDRRADESDNTEISSSGIISSIISMAEPVLVKGGRIVFFLPVRGKQASMPLKKLLQNDLEDCSSLRLLISSSRIQTFSPTFSRWLVCMEKC